MDINAWMQEFRNTLERTFGQRVWFLGLQGSYGRGEASADSDIDVVVILDTLTGDDIARYQAMLDTLPHRELICGFLSGRQEIMNWETGDLFQFYHDTTPILGSLDALLPMLDDGAANKAIKMGVCNLFHGCVHNMLHGKDEGALRGLYKAACFTVQAIVFRQTGTYFRKKQDLMAVAAGAEKEILEISGKFKNGEPVDFDAASRMLMAWTQKWIQSI